MTYDMQIAVELIRGCHISPKFGARKGGDFKTMKAATKAAILFAAILGIASITPRIASAQTSGPAISGVSATILHTGFDAGDLLVKWVETGLVVGHQVGVDYTLSASASVTYACLDTQSFCPTQGPTPLAKDFFLTTNNGTIRQTVSLDEPDPNGDCECPAGDLVLYQVDYSNITIADNSNQVSDQLTGLSETFCSQKHLSRCPRPS